MNCHLCLQNLPLRQSHIISEFQYKPLYDSIHRFHVISADPTEKDRFEQKGLREELLCDRCERHLNRWETYSRDVLFGNAAQLRDQGPDFLRIGGIRYADFKLYLMSLIWRMGASSDPFFDCVDLGPHLERLRQAIISDDPLSVLDYPCILTAVLIEGSFNFDLITQPSLVRHDKQHCYRIVISGILFSFFVSSHIPHNDLANVAISDNGQMTLLIRDARTIPFLDSAFGAQAKARKLRQRRR